MTIEAKERKSTEEPFSKKTYYPPQIMSYGNIVEITRAVNASNPTADGGGVGKNKS